MPSAENSPRLAQTVDSFRQLGIKQVSWFANYEHRYAGNTRLALPPADVGRTAVERRPYHRTLRSAVVGG